MDIPSTGDEHKPSAEPVESESSDYEDDDGDGPADCGLSAVEYHEDTDTVLPGHEGETVPDFGDEELESLRLEGVQDPIKNPLIDTYATQIDDENEPESDEESEGTAPIPTMAAPATKAGSESEDGPSDRASVNSLEKSASVDSLFSIPATAKEATNISQLLAMLDELQHSYKQVRDDFDDVQKEYDMRRKKLGDRIDSLEQEIVIKSQEIDRMERILKGEMMADRRLKPTRTGWMAKRSGGWKDKWFALQGFNLIYCNEESDEVTATTVKGAIILKDPYKMTERSNTFVIHSDSGKEFFLATRTAEERVLWVRDIRAAIAKADIVYYQKITQEHPHLRMRLHLADWVFVKTEKDKASVGLHCHYALLTSSSLLLYEEQPTGEQIGRLRINDFDKFVHPVKVCYPLKGLHVQTVKINVSIPDVRQPKPEEDAIDVLKLTPSSTSKLAPLYFFIDTESVTPYTNLALWERTIRKWVVQQADIKSPRKAGNMLAWMWPEKKGGVGKWVKRYVVLSEVGVLFCFKERPDNDSMLGDLMQLVDVKSAYVNMIAHDGKEHCLEVVEDEGKGRRHIVCAGLPEPQEEWLNACQTVARFRLNRRGTIVEVGTSMSEKKKKIGSIGRMEARAKDSNSRQRSLSSRESARERLAVKDPEHSSGDSVITTERMASHEMPAPKYDPADQTEQSYTSTATNSSTVSSVESVAFENQQQPATERKTPPPKEPSQPPQPAVAPSQPAGSDQPKSADDPFVVA